MNYGIILASEAKYSSTETQFKYLILTIFLVFAVAISVTLGMICIKSQECQNKQIESSNVIMDNNKTRETIKNKESIKNVELERVEFERDSYRNLYIIQSILF